MIKRIYVKESKAPSFDIWLKYTLSDYSKDDLIKYTISIMNDKEYSRLQKEYDEVIKKVGGIK